MAHVDPVGSSVRGACRGGSPTGHVLIGPDAGRAQYEALKGLPPCETREALDALAGETAARVSEEYRVLEIAYDAESETGRRRGCV
ncbi:MAG: hypothetical protein U0325_30220 [Polyangiales bacterium]